MECNLTRFIFVASPRLNRQQELFLDWLIIQQEIESSRIIIYVYSDMTDIKLKNRIVDDWNKQGHTTVSGGYGTLKETSDAAQVNSTHVFDYMKMKLEPIHH